MTSIIEDTKKDNDWGFYVGLVEALTGENYTYPQEGEEFHSDAWDDASPYYHAKKAPKYLKTLLVYGVMDGQAEKEKSDTLVPYSQATKLMGELDNKDATLITAYNIDHGSFDSALEKYKDDYRAAIEDFINSKITT